MLEAVAADFSALDKVELTVILDHRIDELRCGPHRVVDASAADDDLRQLQKMSAEFNWTLVIAPEFDDILFQRCKAVEQAGGRLLGSSSDFVAIAADKQKTAERLREAGVPVAEGVPLSEADDPSETFSYPAVIKHRFGAGSLDVFLARDRDAARQVRSDVRGPLRMERHYAGIPASVAVLVGPSQIVPLLPCRQTLSNDGRFKYLGGVCPLPPELAVQATKLAIDAIAAMSDVTAANGYIGVDMVLGAVEGHENVVIEINPRLTTSYVGLRQLFDGNLAAAMLAVAEGRPVQLKWSNGQVEFDADGTIRCL